MFVGLGPASNALRPEHRRAREAKGGRGRPREERLGGQ